MGKYVESEEISIQNALSLIEKDHHDTFMIVITVALKDSKL